MYNAYKNITSSTLCTLSSTNHLPLKGIYLSKSSILLSSSSTSISSILSLTCSIYNAPTHNISGIPRITSRTFSTTTSIYNSFSRNPAFYNSFSSSLSTNPSISISSASAKKFSTTSSTTLSLLSTSSTPISSSKLPYLLEAAKYYPVNTGWLWLYHAPIFAGLSTSILYTLSIFIPYINTLLPIALGPAFIIHSTTRRLRLPLVLGLAAYLARKFPFLTEIPISTLLTAPVNSLLSSTSTSSSTSTNSSSSGTSTNDTKDNNVINKFFDSMDKVLGMSTLINQYGLAYVLSGRIIGTISLLSFTALLHYGLPLELYIQNIYNYLPSIPYINPSSPSTASSIVIDTTTTTTTSASSASASTTSWFSFLTTANNLTIYWASGCLLVNIFYYPFILNYGIGKLSLVLNGHSNSTTSTTPSNPSSIVATTASIPTIVSHSESISQIYVNTNTNTTISNTNVPANTTTNGSTCTNVSSNKTHWINKYYRNDVNCWHCF